MKSNYQSKVIGLLFVLGGICFFGQQVGLWDVDVFFPGWWTIFLILPAIFSMIEDGARFGNICLFAIGGYFLLEANEWISFRFTFGMIWALLCILVGIRLILGNRGVFRREDNRQGVEDIHTNVVFGSRRINGSGVIHNVDAQCLMGTQYIDLTQADLRNMQSMKLQATMGSIDVIVSSEMNFIVKKDNVLGSCNIQDTPLGKYDIYVDVSSFLGSVNLRKRKGPSFKEGEFKEK